MLRSEMSFVGEPEGDDIAKYFHSCPRCGQPVDRRDLAAVYYHEGVGHKPLPTREALRLVIAEDQLDAILSLKPS
jgi:hypothetical protein